MSLRNNGVNRLPDAEGVRDSDLFTLSREGRWRKLAAPALAAYLVAPTNNDMPSVLDYGAKPGEGYAYNHEAFAAAAIAGHGLVHVPQGEWRLEAVVETPVNSEVNYQGVGSKTIIRQMNPTADAFHFDSNSYLTPGGGLSSMVIEAGAGMRTSGSFGKGSTGTAVRANHRNEGFVLHNIEVNNFDNPFALYGCWNMDLARFWTHFYANVGVLMERGWEGGYGVGGRFISGGARVVGGLISNNGADFDTTNSISLRTKASGGNRFTLLEIVRGNRGVVMDPSEALGEQITYDKYTQVMPDSLTGDGWVIAGDANVWSVKMVDCWSAYNDGYGVLSTNPNARAVHWLGGSIRQNLKSGWRHSAPNTDIFITGAEINDNNRNVSTAPYYQGVEIDPGAGGITVSGNRFSNETGEGIQQFCVAILGGESRNIIVTNNDMRGGYGAVSGVSNYSTTPETIVVEGNTPRGVAGHSPDDARTLAGNAIMVTDTPATVYLGAAGQDSDPARRGWLLAYSGIVTRMFVQSTNDPGVGQTITYTLFKNGVSTGLTASRSGVAGAIAEIAGGVLVAKGDSLTIRRVATAGSGPGDERYFLTVER